MRLSGVRRATVAKHWPRRVTVTVVERSPEAVWQVGGGGYLGGGGGVGVGFCPRPPLDTLVRTDWGRSPTPRHHVDRDAVQLAGRLREMMPPSVGQRPRRFEWSQGAGLEVITDQDQRVRFGDGADIPYKLAVWRGILERANRDKTTVSEIDLRFR